MPAAEILARQIRETAERYPWLDDPWDGDLDLPLKQDQERPTRKGRLISNAIDGDRDWRNWKPGLAKIQRLRPRRFALCHPDREHCAKDLCENCYRALRRGRGYHAFPMVAEYRSTKARAIRRARAKDRMVNYGSVTPWKEVHDLPSQGWKGDGDA